MTLIFNYFISLFSLISSWILQMSRAIYCSGSQNLDCISPFLLQYLYSKGQNCYSKSPPLTLCLIKLCLHYGQWPWQIHRKRVLLARSINHSSSKQHFLCLKMTNCAMLLWVFLVITYYHKSCCTITIFSSMQTVQGSHKHKYLAALWHFSPFAATRMHYLFSTPA